MIRTISAAAAVVTIALSICLPAVAASQDGALVGLHDLRREGNKLCMSDHSHSGTGSGEPTRARAEIAAQRSWSSFTALEYGDHWGSPALASGKTMSCSQGSGGWSCDFEARPCRR
jgi:hypothetical protein